MPGALIETRTVGSIFALCPETIDLQQSWFWFAGVHGIEPQQCILSWSGVMADMQSANCRSNKAPAASTRNSLLPIMLI